MLHVSLFGKEQNNLVSQTKLFDTIARQSIEISEDDVMIYLTLKILSNMNNDFELH